MKRNRLHLVHVIAWCADCEWKNSDYHKARQAAHSHSRTKKHDVHIEVGYAGLIKHKTKQTSKEA